jgi:heat shock protein HspQ
MPRTHKVVVVGVEDEDEDEVPEDIRQIRRQTTHHLLINN